SPAPSSAILFLSRRPPPRAPLFRYTTLFRSEGGRLDLDDLLVAVLPKEQIFDDLLQIGRRVPGRPTVVDAGERADRADVARDVLLASGVPKDRRDRKSTRLNSSHVKRSYAGFCLKKK